MQINNKKQTGLTKAVSLTAVLCQASMQIVNNVHIKNIHIENI